MFTKTGLFTMLDNEFALVDYLHIVPFDTTTDSVVNRLKSTYPKMMMTKIFLSHTIQTTVH